MTQSILKAPSGAGEATRGYTLPMLLDEACRSNPNRTAFNQHHSDEWRSMSTGEFRAAAEELAAGMESVGVARGDHVGMYMHSDVSFCLADMGVLLAGCVNIPIYLSHSEQLMRFTLEDGDAVAVFVSTSELLDEIAGVINQVETIRYVFVMDTVTDREFERYDARMDRAALFTAADLRDRGRARLSEFEDARGHLREGIQPGDLATIIYTSGTTGQPKGVMLTHQNLSSNAIDSFHGLPDIGRGAEETVLSFLPLSHVFQRTMLYGYTYYGHSVYFTTPERIAVDLKDVRPTLFTTVPRLLERVYEKILDRGEELSGVQKRIFDTALGVARRHRVGTSPSGWDRLLHPLADRLVFRRWREALGGRVKFVISGSAALQPELIHVFDAAGVTILEGYGLTESSPVVTFSRAGDVRPGTVGVPIAGVEVKIADDSEILTRGSHVMKGYYKNPEATAEAIDDDGWLHTGDLGAIENGHLKITGRKKSLFKLSTGKFVIPQPLESTLQNAALVDKALVLGEGRKFCSALLFPNLQQLSQFAQRQGLDSRKPLEELVDHPGVRDRFQEIVDRANEQMPSWSTIKQFAVIPKELTIDEGFLTPTMKVRRNRVEEAFGETIEELYRQPGEEDIGDEVASGNYPGSAVEEA